MRALAILALVLLSSCDLKERLREKPRPPSVPADAKRDRTSGLWVQTQPTSIKMYFPEGTIAAEGALVLGMRQGIWSMYSPEGVVLSRGKFVNDFRDGVWEYNDERGKLYLTMTYAQEPKRELLTLLTHDYGNENGPYKRYYPDGRLEEEGRFHAGYFDGPIIRYHPNGRVLLRGQYQKDLMTGRWTYYYPDGTLLREENYASGQLDGELRAFHPDGRLYMEARYKAGAIVTGPVLASR
jgi:antitoxin component YwqK of YwqJK toxin-antitoxin module